MKKDELKKLLPQREPMLLVDEACKNGDECVSSYTVRGDEFFLQGHFPGRPTVPGVILCEIMGQGAVLLLEDELDGDTLTLLAGMDKVRFKRTVSPGETVVTRSRVLQKRGKIVFVEATASVNGQICCSAQLTVSLVKPE